MSRPSESGSATRFHDSADTPALVAWIKERMVRTADVWSWRPRDDEGVSTPGLPLTRGRRSRWAPAALAAVLVVLGVVATAVRLDAPADGTVIDLARSSWHRDGVTAVIAGDADGSGLQTGDLVTAVGDHRLADGLGGVARPPLGTSMTYGIVRDERPTSVEVSVDRPDPYSLLVKGWGNLVFVLILAGLAVALYLRRREEPATAPLLVLAAALLGSTLTVVAGLPVLALATGGAQLWLFHLNVIGVYSIAWAALLAFSVTITPDHPWLRRPRLLTVGYAAPVVVTLVWSGATALFAENSVRWLGLVHSGVTAVSAAALLVSAVCGLVAYRSTTEPITRSRLRWLAGGGALAALLGIAGWSLPDLIVGRHPLPPGAIGLSGLPFVVGIAVALRRHRLFDIERLANRSIVYSAVVAVLVAGYAATVALLVGGLGLSGPVAAALAAAGAALALAPLRNAAQSAVNRLMYGDRHDPAAALDRLGSRLHAVMLPADVLPAVVETVARSLRVPYAGIEIADGTGAYHVAADHGVPVGDLHVEPLLQHGATVGRLLVSARGRDDPLDSIDRSLISSLAQQIGPAVHAVRLHDDLVRSRSEIVALREDERRRIRRDLHDGLGPTLAAIGLKADLAARGLAGGSAEHRLLSEISTEVKAALIDVRRLVEALRPPALDELGLVGAIRSRAASLAGGMLIDVAGPVDPVALPAAVETAAYRIAVEAMTNAVRHSRGRHCTVLIAPDARLLELTVRDDGVGLDPARAIGVGLRSMRERADEVGGSFSVGSPAGGGTVVYASLPTGLGGHDDPADPRR
jgi:signal transduction histidine kinase